MKNLSLADKLAISWIEFLNQNDIEITNEVGYLFKHKFFEIQKGFFFDNNPALVDEVALKRLSVEIKNRFGL